MCPVNGRSWAAISKTLAATPEANKPSFFEERRDRHSRGWPCCETGHTAQLTVALEWRKLPYVFGMDRDGSQVFRRLIVSVTLVASLLGIVQSALACDCCPKGSAPGCIERSAAWGITTGECCAAAPVGSSPWFTAQTRHAADQASGSPALFAVPAAIPVAQQLLRGASAQLGHYRSNESLTYLRTARLRL